MGYTGGAAGQCDLHSLLHENANQHSEIIHGSGLPQQQSDGESIEPRTEARDISVAQDESITAEAAQNAVKPSISFHK